MMRVIIIFACIISILSLLIEDNEKRESTLILDAPEPVPTYNDSIDTFPARMVPVYEFKEQIIPIEK